MDNVIHLKGKSDEYGIFSYWFSLSTDDENLYNRTFDAIIGNVISTLKCVSWGDYHLAQGYRDYMLWALLPGDTDINAFLSAILLAA